MRSRAVASGVAVLVSLSCGGASEDTAADLIIGNAHVYTLAWPEPAKDGTPSAQAPYDNAGWHYDAEAIAIRDGRIVYVGKSSGAARYVGDRTEVFDAHGATVLPGLVDAHVHLANLGAALRRVDLVGVTTEEEVVRRVEERAGRTPPGEWIVGYGWDEGAWASHYPTMALLSARVPNHPVWLGGLHTFAGWGNKVAFERAKITSATKAPVGGEIRKDAAGKPTGILLNNATTLVESVIPRPTDKEMDLRMTLAMDAMTNAGYTSVHDANIDSAMLASLGRHRISHPRGFKRLSMRVEVMLSVRDSQLVREWLKRGPDTASGNRLIVRGVKGFYDGALGSRGALLGEPYVDRPNEHGRGGAEFGFNEALMAEAAGRGFQLVVHAIGDAGNTQTLDFFERVYAKYPNARTARNRVEHAQVLAPADIPRFAKLDLIASVQPGHAVEDMAWAEQRVGPVRIKGAYAWRDLRASGAHMLLSSDMPGSSYDFFYMIHSALTRTDKTGAPKGGWFPAQRLTPEEAVRGYTTWAAYASFSETNAGTIAVGKWADLTILDRDPFVLGATRPDSLLGGRALATIVGGRVVYEAGGANFRVRKD